MFKNLKRNFAKVALVVLALQLAVMGLGTGATGAYAEISSIQLKTNIDEQMFVTGEETGFTVSLSNVGGVEYPAIYSTFEINGAQTSNIESFQYLETGDGLWHNVPVADGVSSVVGYFGNPTTGFPVTVGYQATSQFRIAFKTPGTYSANITVIDVTDGTTEASLPIPSIVVGENISLTADLPASVQLGATVPFKAVLDNTYGSSHNVNTTVTVKDSLIGDIKMKNGAVDVVLTQGVTDSTVAFSGTIVAGAKTTDLFNLTLSFLNVDKVYTYTVDVTDAISSELLATYSGAVFADGSGPVVTMTSKPVIVNDVKKAIEVTFTGNEDIKLKSTTNIEFTQDSVVYTGIAVQVNPAVISVTIPADTFVAGVAPIYVSATFTDVVLNEKVFADQIKVDTVAPDPVTNLTPTFDALGHVTLTWINPTTSYSKLVVYRLDGGIVQELAKGVTTYTDNTTELGLTYSYLVAVFDEAGNSNNGTSVSVRPVTIVAATSDNSNFAMDTSNVDTNINTNTPTEEVKADTTEGNNTAADNKNEFPIWGIILLLILAAIGGYLIWNQKPVVEPAPKAKKK